MSDNSAKRLLTTGEVAQECGVTVRTVQYYDEKGLLSPTQPSEGGRRLYDEQALATMRTICLLKALGLTLKAIRGVLESDGSPEVLQCLLEQQEIELMGKVECDQDMLKAVRAELARIRGVVARPELEEEPQSTPIQRRQGTHYEWYLCRTKHEAVQDPAQDASRGHRS